MSSESVIAIIPARGGSKSVPGKNIRSFGGKPLIAWSIELARRMPEIRRVIVSTDDENIARVSRDYGAEVYARPAHLATDSALVIDALKDLIRTLGREGEASDVFVLLEATSPLREERDVRACLDLFATGAFDSIATFKEADLNPHRAWKIVADRPEVFIPGAVPWLPRQQLPPAYQLNGAVYLFRGSLLLQEERSVLFGRTGAVMMPRERSYDINDAYDFVIAEDLLKAGIS